MELVARNYREIIARMLAGSAEQGHAHPYPVSHNVRTKQGRPNENREDVGDYMLKGVAVDRGDCWNQMSFRKERNETTHKQVQSIHGGSCGCAYKWPYDGIAGDCSRKRLLLQGGKKAFGVELWTVAELPMGRNKNYRGKGGQEE